MARCLLVDDAMSKQPPRKKRVTTTKPHRDDNTNQNAPKTNSENQSIAKAAAKEKTQPADATPPTRDAPKTSRQNGRFNTVVSLLLALGCFIGAFLCGRTIELVGGYFAVANLIIQIPAMLGTLGLAVLGFMFLLCNAD